MRPKKILTEDPEYSKLLNKKIFISKTEQSTSGGRRIVRMRCTDEQGKRANRRRNLAHYIWNLHYPKDPIKKGECIHHIDGNALNDEINNLKKMKMTAHHVLHKKEGEHEKRIRQWNKAYECQLK
jgi:hypothetical protein